MLGVKKACEIIQNGTDHTALKSMVENSFSEWGIYPDSVYNKDGVYFFIARDDEAKKLVIIGNGEIISDFLGTEESCENLKIKTCELNHENCVSLRKYFPFTVPTNVLGFDKSMGLGDRLGLASAGHIRLMKKYGVKPILAQQSIRELNLTGRTYTGVLDDASWAVFQEGFESGFGADGDHLKTHDEVQMALDEGFTMITLDCSEHISNEASDMPDSKISEIYSSMGKSYNVEKYAGSSFKLNNGYTIEFSLEDCKRIAVIYGKAIDFAVKIYTENIKNCDRHVDFEISIDETLTSTLPQAHFFVASELVAAGVKAATIAPRFCGEFQKGIDYIGDLEKFEEEFSVHAEIAKYFGYKISVHSGSDKFLAFPIVGKYTQGKYHVKTAGTNWLEAVRVIALKNPGLYRQIHKFALGVLDKAKAYYHIKGNPENIADIDTLSDSELPELMNQDDARQVIHITYGFILQEKDEYGKVIFKDGIYSTLHKYEEDYYKALEKHIGKHLEYLGE